MRRRAACHARLRRTIDGWVCRQSRAYTRGREHLGIRGHRRRTQLDGEWIDDRDAGDRGHRDHATRASRGGCPSTLGRRSLRAFCTAERRWHSPRPSPPGPATSPSIARVSTSSVRRSTPTTSGRSHPVPGCSPRSRPAAIGRRSHVWEVRITNEAGKLVCISRCTLAVIEMESSYAPEDRRGS